MGKIENEMNFIDTALGIAKDHLLETEVIYSAMKALQENNDMSIIDALSHALAEWDL